MITALDASVAAELAPLVRRVVALDPTSLVRIRTETDAATAFARLPFGVLVGRRVAGQFDHRHDGTFLSAELLRWLEALDTADAPAIELIERGHEWRGAVPPESGWRRVEAVPGEVIRGLVRQGAMTVKDAARREGVPEAQPRADVADALLDSIVLTATAQDDRVEVTLRLISALVRMGFLARDSHCAIDVTRGWVRVAATYGSVYAEQAPAGSAGLALRSVRAQPHGGIGR